MASEKHGILSELTAGFRRFQKNWYFAEHDLYSSLREGQNPKGVIIACSDSRVDPAHVLDCAPGDLFVIRNVANLVPPYEPDKHCHGVSSALEYAVRHLHVPNIIVMGHAHCGGIKNLMQMDAGHNDECGSVRHEFLDIWMQQAESARQHVLASFGTDAANRDEEKLLRECEKYSIRLSLQNLLTFPWIAAGVQEGTLALHGLYFDLSSGELFYFNQDEGRFVPMGDHLASINDS